MKGLRGDVYVPGDKSITHRAIMFGAIAEGDTTVITSTLGRDNLGTIRIMRQLGVRIGGTVTPALLPIAHDEKLTDFNASTDGMCTIVVHGGGLDGLRAPAGPLDCGNSGTTARLLSGLLAGQPFSSTLVGDASLSKRPFKRVTVPLGEMGARFSGDLLPLTIQGGELHGIKYRSPQASAQVKSAIILAGLRTAEGVTIEEPRLSRDHTERMLTAMGCAIDVDERSDGSAVITLPPRSERGTMRGQRIEVPGDFSAAAFFLVAGSIVPDAEITVRRVLYNKTRIGLFSILERMGAQLEIINRREIGGEPVVDIVVRSAPLRGIDVTPEEVVLAIDEIPILCIAAAAAEGVTTIRGAHELRVKESDRITMTRRILESFGGSAHEVDDGLDVTGDPLLGRRLRERGPLDSGAVDRSGWGECGDHRISMAAAVLELLLSGDFSLAEKEAVETSFPTFEECLRGIVI